MQSTKALKTRRPATWKLMWKEEYPTTFERYEQRPFAWCISIDLKIECCVQKYRISLLNTILILERVDAASDEFGQAMVVSIPLVTPTRPATNTEPCQKKLDS